MIQSTRTMRFVHVTVSHAVGDSILSFVCCTDFMQALTQPNHINYVYHSETKVLGTTISLYYTMYGTAN